LALAHKGLDVELRDARANPAEGAVALWPPRTVPVLVDGDRSIGDSTSIMRYLDVAYPEKPLWPTNGEDAHVAFSVGALVDGFLNTIIDVGTRYYALSMDSAWPKVMTEMLGRANDTSKKLVSFVTRPYLTSVGWCAADMTLYTMVAWFEGLPARALSNQNVKQIVSLGVSLPPELARWAEQHEDRADVRALG
jgi:glutathione S-transferase